MLAFQINVFNDASSSPDYRIPDMTFVSAGREHVIARDGVRGEGPDAVIEIRSPGDETYDKFPFFARIGVREVIVVDRDTKQLEIYRLVGSQYVADQMDSGKWLRSEVLQVRFTTTEPAHLVVEDLDDPSVRVEVQRQISHSVIASEAKQSQKL